MTATIIAAIGSLFMTAADAEKTGLYAPHIFSDYMVIQRDRPIRVWGSAEPNAETRVQFAGQDATVQADESGNWLAELEPMPMNAEPQTLTISSGGEIISFKEILIGDVWLLSGQSNMEHNIGNVYHGDAETASANYPNLRLMTIPHMACPDPLEDFERHEDYDTWAERGARGELKGAWSPCTPASTHHFSAIGYVFGRRVHTASGVPIGLIDASWGGTTLEAWLRMDAMEAIPLAEPFLQMWRERIEEYDPEENLKMKIERWEQDTERRKERGEQPNPKPTEPDQSPAFNRGGPAAAFNGMVAPYANFNIKGTLFNHGFNNALGDSRPKLYAAAFKGLIVNWRKVFRDEEMPFGIVELTAGGQPQTRENFEERMVDAAPYIREGQAMAWRALPNVGFASAYDQQVNWYHPQKKFELGERIARWGLGEFYDQEHIGWQPADCIEWKLEGDRAVLKFDRPVQVNDGRPFEGFAVAGEDRHFYPASAEYVKIGKDDRGRDRLDKAQLKVSSPFVEKVRAVRYAWARNPLGNVVNDSHHERTIPIVLFRTDNWEYPEAPYGHDAYMEHRGVLHRLRQQAAAWAKERRVQEAQLTLFRHWSDEGYSAE